MIFIKIFKLNFCILIFTFSLFFLLNILRYINYDINYNSSIHKKFESDNGIRKSAKIKENEQYLFPLPIPKSNDTLDLKEL